MNNLTQLLSLLADAKELNYSYEITKTFGSPTMPITGYSVEFHLPNEDGGSLVIDVEPHQINHYSTVRKFFNEKLNPQRLRKTALAKLTPYEIEILGIKT